MSQGLGLVSSVAKSYTRLTKGWSLEGPMPVFALLLRGENFLIRMEEGVPERMGFYTTRYVRARNEEEAETRAVQMVRQAKSLRANIRTASLTPMIYVEIIERRPWWHRFKMQPGFAFWNMDKEDEREASEVNEEG